ncbi:creatininase family protein [Pseudahrensia aquimaris]|uniref:Creatininase family protein n=1 Tax=Pseudahrensia aquimaris TaxID=744461 RepID=A0ABW3FBV8_9HYPH
MTLRWQELKTTDFGQTADNRIAVLPVAAIEQHGPHLPLGTDAIIANGLVDRAITALPDGSPALFLPCLEIGKSTEHGTFPGTLSLSWTTAIKTLLDIGDSIARSGVKKLIIITSHGGNSSSMETAGRELRAKQGMMVVTTAWERLGMERTDPIDIHGGELETSIMLALRPDLVDMEKAEDFKSTQSEMKSNNDHLGFHTSNASISWLAQDLNTNGVVGNAAAATREQGEKHIERSVSGFIKLLEETAKTSI